MNKFKRGFVALLILQIALTGSACAQPHKGKSSANFLIDPKKPYVYLEVDHIGPRRPMSEDEPHVGIWLRLHNNCIVPIVLNTLGNGQVFDSVIANGYPSIGVSINDESLNKAPGYPTTQDMASMLWGAPGKSGPPSKRPANPHPATEEASMPVGYWADTGGVTTIYPGESLDFSIPRNQVSPKWHVEISFEFELDVHSEIPSAYNYVALYERQVTEKTKRTDGTNQ